ncbi:MAG TPA: sialidase family protein [Solirubrobacterales bacterium]
MSRRRLGLVAAVVAVASAALSPGSATAAWETPAGTNTVVSQPSTGGGYPVPPGQTAPDPGTCRTGQYNSNFSESWLAVKPGTEDLVGTSKFFFETYSTFYDFHLGSFAISNGTPLAANQVQGYDCISTGTQAMPPSWTNNTDPNADFDTKGRVYQVTLPFNAFWANLHPNSNIAISYSDDMGRHWVKGNGGEPLEQFSNSTAKTLGRVEDKQWVAVNHIVGSPYQDHVYATWAVFNGQNTKLRVAVSRDRGQTFSDARTISTPSGTGPVTEFIYPSLDAAGNVYIAVASDKPTGNDQKTIYVTRSRDDGRTWSQFMPVVEAKQLPGCCLPNTTFRDGILEHFAASPDHPGHLYMVWEDWDGSQYDVKFSQSIDSGVTWSEPMIVNDNANRTTTDQFQPQVAAGPRGAVAVNFYDRRAACPAGDPSIVPGHVGRTNFCIDVSLQAFKDNGAGAVTVGDNVRVSQFTWDPEQPDQTIDGIDQMACAAHQDPCTTRAFIGDYFGLAISDANVYTLAVSTHYPSGVTADPPPVSSGGPVYYQQQVLETVSRAALGI